MILRILLLGAVAVCGVFAGDWFPVNIEAPTYPILGNQAQIQGVVRLRVTLDLDGAVSRADIQSGTSVLAAAARDNIKLWKFSAPCKDTQKVSQVIEFTYDFRLEGVLNEHPTTRFRYEQPYRAIVVSQSLRWTPEAEKPTR